MTLNSVLQQNYLKDRRLQFMRAHQEAFDVEPTLLLSLFEEAVLEIEGTCGVEPICNVQKDQLFPVEFQVSNEERTWPRTLPNLVKFLDKVETQVGFRLNRSLLEKFLEVHIGSQKIDNNTIGIELRPREEDSCIKVYFHLDMEKSCEELVKTALELDGGTYSTELLQVLFKSTLVIGFNMFLNGHTEIEIWPLSPGEQYEEPKLNRCKYLKYYIQKNFSQKVNALFKEASFLAVAFSKNKLEPLLIFHYEDLKDIRKNFSFNSNGDRIYQFCQSQDCINYAAVGVTERELEKARLEKFSFIYNKRDKCEHFLSVSKQKK